MKLVDLNVILYAVNRDTPLHQASRAWWEGALNGDETVGLPWVVLLGFLRIATHPSIFARPLSPEAAARHVTAWLAREQVHLVREKDDHWQVLSNLLKKSGTAGNLTTDAHLATLAITHDATLVSYDTDFARFPGLRRELL